MVINPPVDQERLSQIVAAAGSMSVMNAANEAEAAKAVSDADAFFGKITPSMLAAAAGLRWVQAATASLEHYIFPELIEHSCVVTNMRGIYSDVIADHVFGFIICFARNFHRYIRSQTNAAWAPQGGESERSTFAAGPGTVSGIDRARLHLADATLGVVGLGGIGCDIAQRGLAFGMHVLAVDPVPVSVPPGVVAVWRLDRLPDLLAQSDFVVIAAPHTPETVKLFRRPQFRQMKRTAYLINVGRGVIVDLADLTAALQAAEIAGAGLDVFEAEPLPPGHALWNMENVIITPHVAGCSPRIAERHLGVLLDNIRRFVRGEPLRNVVDKRHWF
jgi:phosphoglycerate dehydrogenase-like enzyme